MTKDSEEEKDKGNACIKEKKYIEAMFHYTAAIKQQPKNATLYSNRSLAFKHMEQYFHAMEDAQKAISLNPNWAKGYFRLGEVQFAAEHYQDALWSYKQALNLSQDDETLQQSVTKARQHLHQQNVADKRMPMYGIGAGALSGVCIVIADLVLTENPVLKHIVLQILLILAVAAIGYGISLAYRYITRSQRAGLLEEPIDLLGFGNSDNSAPAENTNSTEHSGTSEDDKKPRKRKSAAAARHQAKQSSKI